MSSTVASTTGAMVTPPPSPLAPAPDFDLESDLSEERRRERLVRLPNHLKPCEGHRCRKRGIVEEVQQPVHVSMTSLHHQTHVMCWHSEHLPVLLLFSLNWWFNNSFVCVFCCPHVAKSREKLYHSASVISKFLICFLLC